ncbi:MAG: type II toxin-antitoxin system VapC family toxin [Chloroflexota bacterium]
MAVDAYVLDAHPIVGSYRGESFRPFVQGLIRQARQGEIDLRLTAVNAGEIVYGIERSLGRAAGEDVLQELQVWTHIVAADLELSLRAAWFKLRGGISYADCFAAALAHRDGIPLITGDPEFRRVEDVIRVVWLDSLAT